MQQIFEKIIIALQASFGDKVSIGFPKDAQGQIKKWVIINAREDREYAIVLQYWFNNDDYPEIFFIPEVTDYCLQNLSGGIDFDRNNALELQKLSFFNISQDERYENDVTINTPENRSIKFDFAAMEIISVIFGCLKELKPVVSV